MHALLSGWKSGCVLLIKVAAQVFLLGTMASSLVVFWLNESEKCHPSVRISCRLNKGFILHAPLLWLNNRDRVMLKGSSHQLWAVIEGLG